MTLRADFDRYLSHLGPTVPVSTLHLDPESPALCALRHDIDHDLDVALEMAHQEHERGMRATYFVLPSAPYWNDTRLIEKCLQLQDYGHEVGLHVNCMAEWAGGDIEVPEAALRSQLSRLRDGGIEIQGISAHGDRRCYEHQVSNYWCFRELRPECPVLTESGRSAEGTLEQYGSTTRLLYPDDDEVARADGMRYRLWSISLSSLGLEYHAWHTSFDRYFSDSGGSWTRTPDPMTIPRGKERWQVLMHPIHWRGPRRLYFFLSTARSGSRWLTDALNHATPFEARHEYILNQDFHRGETARKATASFRTLEDDPDSVRARLSEAWEELEQIKNDYAEVNVYLPTFVKELRRYFPDAVFVHLRRNPAEVVRSLMDRDWYDTPEDHAHPRLRNADATSIEQFERVCRYVAEVNDRLQETCDDRVELEQLTRSPDSLYRALRRLGIPYHPRLGDHLVTTIINAARKRDFPSPDRWTTAQKQCFNRVCGDATRNTCYSSPGSPAGKIRQGVLGWLYRLLRQGRQAVPQSQSAREDEIPVDPVRFKGTNCDVSARAEGITISPHTGDRHAYLTLAGSSWYALVTEKGRSSGWPVRPMCYVRGAIDLMVPGTAGVTVFAISYGVDGKQTHRRQLGILDAQRPHTEFAFAPHPEATTFDVALYLSASRESRRITIGKCGLGYKAHN